MATRHYPYRKVNFSPTVGARFPDFAVIETGSTFMEESHIWLNTLLSQVHDSGLQGDMTEEQFLHAVLYTLATHMIDWDSSKWLVEQERRYWDNLDNVQSHVHLLMEYCGRKEKVITDDAHSYNRLSSILERITDSLDDADRVGLFDALFYYTVAQLGFDRRHAQISAALATGLAHDEQLIDLQPYSGEAIVTHFERHQGRFSYELVQTDSAVLDLINLRLAVHGIEADLIQDPSDNFGHSGLSLLDDPAYALMPLSTLLQRLEQDMDTERTLMVFKPSRADKSYSIKRLRRYLDERDLLEAVFDFTSYNETGKTIRCSAWLLNRRKPHHQQTLCIDTRQLLNGTQDVTAEELAYFAAAICEIWTSRDRSNLSRLPRFGALGSLKGVFTQCFDNGYRDIDGLCTVLSSRQVINGAITANRVKPSTTTRDLPLLDRRSLDQLLAQTRCLSFCAYIIGNNGAGKSLLLASLVEDLQRQSISSVAIVVGPIDRFPLGDHRKYPSYRYLGDRTSTGYSSQKIERRLIRLLMEIIRMPGRLDLLESVLDSLGFKQRLYLAPNAAFNELLQPLDLVGQVIPLARAQYETIPSSGMTLALVRQTHSNLLKFSELSSGEQQILVLFAKIMASAGPGKVLLIDEPEVSLHVGWQQMLPSLFSQMAEQLQTRFVIATHSPTLIANAQDRLSHCFMAKDKQLTEISPEQRHSVETILLKGFETYTPHNREVAERCAALVAEAIRVTNIGEEDHFDDQLSDLQNALGEMTSVMSTSGDLQDKRYQQDRQLIEQAGQAIKETFDLARQASLA